jgi:undecaprenyl-diphosphatase
MLDFLTQLDSHIFILINSHHTLFFDKFFLIITQLGNGCIAVPLVAVIIVAITPRSFLARALLCAAIAGICAGAANTQIKRAVHRPRPVVYFEKQLIPRMENSMASTKVHIVGKCWRQNSFPSGHAATAFAAATILALLYGGSFSLCFVPALLVAYSRVYIGVHFPIDVLGGAVLGSVVAMLVIVFFRMPRPLPSRRNHAE